MRHLLEASLLPDLPQCDVIGEYVEAACGLTAAIGVYLYWLGKAIGASNDYWSDFEMHPMTRSDVSIADKTLMARFNRCF